MNTLVLIAAAVAVLATVLVITRHNAVHALLFLVVSLLAVALIFFLLGAPFVAALEVIIYAGAIMVFFIFVVMMLNLGPEAVAQERRLAPPSEWIGPGLLALILLFEFVVAITRGGSGDVSSATPIPPQTVSLRLFSAYALGVELASFVLLAGLIAAFHIARRHGPNSATMRALTERDPSAQPDQSGGQP